MTEEELRIRSYLEAQGAELSPAEIIDKVRAAMAQLRAAADAVPAARFDERPGDDEWSANEVLAHVVEAGRHFGDSRRRRCTTRGWASATRDGTADGRGMVGAARQ